MNSLPCRTECPNADTNARVVLCDFCLDAVEGSVPLGENFISLLISKAVSRDSRHTFDCLTVSPIARFSACP